MRRPLLDTPARAAPAPGADRAPLAGGGVISIVGPDGAGKTTLIDALVGTELSGAPLLRMRRPGILYRRTVPDVPVTEPHKDPPYPPLLSLAKTAYIWADVFLGWALRIKPFARRGGWVIIERGWWDIAVDPLRYRMQPHGRLLWWLGSALPKPDLLLVLEAPPEVVYARKTELTLDELRRQMAAWRDHLPRAQRHAFLDASRPAEEVVAQAAHEVARHFGAGSGAGWAGLPRRGRPRWVLPRGPRPVASSGLYVYQPINRRARVGWAGLRALAATGLFRLLPPGAAPPGEVTAALAPHVPPGTTLSVARANHPGRFVALAVGPAGECRAVAKVAADDAGRRALAAEADAVAELGGLLEHPLRAPAITARADGVVVYEMSPWRPRTRPWRLPTDVAHAIGRFHRAGPGSLAHGDFAPWNLLRGEGGWTLIDWEHAHRDAPPFYDLWHYLVQSHALLRRPRARELGDGLAGRGWVGETIAAYAAGAGLDPRTARTHLPAYLARSVAYLDPGKPDGAAGVRARARLSSLLEA
jgi:thymidylate kinase